ncbi:MAG: DNA cytosine methyltransferase [Vulcanimicrobiaceae bacterium]
MARQLKAVDLFSGCGGMTLGLRRAGFDVAAAIEIDALAAETYRLNHPNTFVVEQDIRSVDTNVFARRVLGRRTRLDLLAACPPCQGYSAVRTLRRRPSASDERNRLVFEVLRFVDALSPRALLFENVPGLIKDWRFAKFKAELKRRGYSVQYGVEDAADYGVPQRRQRLILFATLLPMSHLPKVKSARRTVADALSGLLPVGESGDPLHDYSERRGDRIRRMIKRIPRDGGSRGDLSDDMQLECHKRTDGFYDVYGRMKWDDVAPTITAGCINPSKGRFLHPESNRAVTLREAALLQSFPVDYRFSLRRGRFAVAEMIGNALPPLVVEKQAKAIRNHLRM